MQFLPKERQKRSNPFSTERQAQRSILYAVGEKEEGACPVACRMPGKTETYRPRPRRLWEISFSSS